MIKLCCYVIRSTRHPEGSQWPPPWSAPAADPPRDVWWTASRNYTVLFLSRDVKHTEFNQYIPVLLSSLSMSDSRFRKLVMLWMWRHHDMVLWRPGGGAWHNGLILTTASNATAELTLLTTWLHCGKRVKRKISNVWSRASCGPYHGLEHPNYGIKDIDRALTHLYP